MFTMLVGMAVVNPPASLTEVTPVSRRERARASTKADILHAARKLLVAGGVENVTQRGIAGELGMTAPALYRYFDSRELILTELIQALYDELSMTLFEVDGTPATPDSNPLARDRFRRTAHAFRTWALAHKAEFGLLFGAPIPGVEKTPQSEWFSGDMKFCGLWLALYMDVIRENPAGVPAPEDINPALREQLQPFCDFLQGQLSVGAAALFLSGWTQLYGAIAIEVFGHLSFAIQDASLLFENLLDSLSKEFGIEPE